MECFAGRASVWGLSGLAVRCWGPRFDGAEWGTAAVEKTEESRFFGDRFDGEVTGVMTVVVVRARADQRVHVGPPAVCPVGHVVAFDVLGCLASGVTAATVAVLDHAPGADRDDALGAADVDGGPFRLLDGLHHAVTTPLTQEVWREGDSFVEPAVAGSVEV